MPERNVLPKPYTLPHPPLWVAAGNPSTFEKAARMGLGVLCFASTSREDLARLIEVYKNAIDDAEPVGGYVNDNVMVTSQMLCLEDGNRARKIASNMTSGYQNSLVYQLPRHLPEAAVRPGLAGHHARADRRDARDGGQATAPCSSATRRSARRPAETWVDTGADQLTLRHAVDHHAGRGRDRGRRDVRQHGPSGVRQGSRPQHHPPARSPARATGASPPESEAFNGSALQPRRTGVSRRAARAGSPRCCRRSAREPRSTDWPGRREYDTAWQRMLFDAGYAGINWPKEYGGRGATPTEHLIFLEESERAGAPYVGVNFVGLLHAGPTLIAEASPEVQQAHLLGDPARRRGLVPGLLRARRRLRPGVAALQGGARRRPLRRHRAEDLDLARRGRRLLRDAGPHRPGCPETQGDHLARRCRWTRPASPSGRCARSSDPTEFAEMFLDEVRIPVEQPGRRGERRLARHQRHAVLRARHRVRRRRRRCDRAGRRARRAGQEGHPPRRRRRGTTGRCAASSPRSPPSSTGSWALTKRNVSEAQRIGRVGFGGSIFKLRYSEVRQHLADVAAQLLGRASLAMDDLDGLPNARFAEERLQWLNLSIAAGTSQIQRNIIGERVLGLPRGAVTERVDGFPAHRGSRGAARRGPRDLHRRVSARAAGRARRHRRRLRPGPLVRP